MKKGGREVFKKFWKDFFEKKTAKNRREREGYVSQKGPSFKRGVISIVVDKKGEEFCRGQGKREGSWRGLQPLKKAEKREKPSRQEGHY